MAYNKARTTSRATQNGAIGRSIATTRQKLRDNTERLQGPDVSGSASRSNYHTYNNPVQENTHLTIHTTTTCPDASRVDDQLEPGVKYLYPDQFEYTTDRSDRVPAWNSVKEDIVPKDAVFRTVKESQLVECFHKGPKMHQYTVAENNMISSGGQVNPINKMPTHSDGNKV